MNGSELLDDLKRRKGKLDSLKNLDSEKFSKFDLELLKKGEINKKYAEKLQLKLERTKKDLRETKRKTKLLRKDKFQRQ